MHEQNLLIASQCAFLQQDATKAPHTATQKARCVLLRKKRGTTPTNFATQTVLIREK